MRPDMEPNIKTQSRARPQLKLSTAFDHGILIL
ncbi:MAG: hypothetical protein ACI8YI_002896, partial [Paracoccaceae bacterium]